jgi:hypothetical protein
MEQEYRNMAAMLKQESLDGRRIGFQVDRERR